VNDGTLRVRRGRVRRRIASWLAADIRRELAAIDARNVAAVGVVTVARKAELEVVQPGDIG
jgi:hypothetical protein